MYFHFMKNDVFFAYIRKRIFLPYIRMAVVLQNMEGLISKEYPSVEIKTYNPF
jgi:hypothetical protein